MSGDLADLSRLPEIEEQRGGDPELLFAELLGVIKHGIETHPRTLQKRLGPSDIGDPCARRLAYKLTDTPHARQMPPAWRPTVGTAVHAWLEETFAEHNQALRDQHRTSRFLIEQRVNAGPCGPNDLDGSTDLYDRVTATSIDWKVVGPSSHKKLRGDVKAGRGPRPEYRVQLHTYGLGFTRRGLPVDRVMLVALPSAGELDDAVMWWEDYDPAIGADGHGCRFCPWLKGGSTDLTQGCPGVADTEAPAALQALIA